MNSFTSNEQNLKNLKGPQHFFIDEQLYKRMALYLFYIKKVLDKNTEM